MSCSTETLNEAKITGKKVIPIATQQQPKPNSWAPSLQAIKHVSPEQFREHAAKRKIYIYSVNLEGIGFLKLFRRLGYEVGGFIDSRSYTNNQKRGAPVIHPDRFFAELVGDALVVITAKHRQTKRHAIEQCEAAGLVKRETFYITTDLCDLFPTIEVAGLCNLKCISCNMGIPGVNKAGGLMTAENYRKVVQKMQAEIPFMNSIYLYLWGEPLINPEIAEILKINAELGVACEVSTNLNDARHLENVILAEPEVLVVPCAGVGEKYEVARTGGKWDVFKKHLYLLRELLDKHNSETVVRIHYHMYRDNLEEDFDEVEALAKELNFMFLPILAQIFPEYVLRQEMFGETLPEEMQRADKLLYFPIADQLAYAKQNTSRNCFMMKVFPVVRWDTAVVHCSNLTFPTLAKSYLDVSLDDLLKERYDNEFCVKCMDHSMHRFFDVAASIQMVDGKRTIVRD